LKRLLIEQRGLQLEIVRADKEVPPGIAELAGACFLATSVEASTTIVR
jgi:hypothetical protein